MKVTTHYCDFSTEVPQHLAQFQIVLPTANGHSPDGGAADLGINEVDACAKHLHQMQMDLFNHDAKSIKIKRIPDVPLVAVAVPRRSTGAGKNQGKVRFPDNWETWTCEEHNVGPYSSKSGLAHHLYAHHPEYRNDPA